MLPHPLQIIVSLPLSFDHFRRIWKGIQNYADEHPDVVLIHTHGFAAHVLQDSSAHGLIALIPDEGTSAQIVSCGIPTVNISNRAETAGICKVVNDDHYTGVLAGRHLLECGYRQFYFTGGDLIFSQQRLRGFCEALEAEGQSVHCFRELSHSPISLAELLRWKEQHLSLLQSALLPGAGCFCATGMGLSALLRDLKINLANQSADFGLIAGDAPESDWPAEACFSHIQLNCERIGYRAAERLHRHLIGVEPLLGDVEYVAPVGLFKGKSTSPLGIKDSIVHRARLLMEEMPPELLTATHLAKEMRMDRKTLYSHFNTVTGMSLADAIKEHKLHTAQRLLQSTELTVAAIAQRVGYAKESAFIYSFRKQVGITPSKYRSMR